MLYIFHHSVLRMVRMLFLSPIKSGKRKKASVQVNVETLELFPFADKILGFKKVSL